MSETHYSKVKVTVCLLLALLLLISPASAYTQEQVTNGGFSSGLTGWTTGTNVGDDGFAQVAPYGSGGQSGGYANLWVTCEGVYGGWANSELTQSVDLTGVSTLTYYVYCDSYDHKGVSGTNRFSVYIDGTQISTTTSPQFFDTWTQESIDVSAYSGAHTITFYASTSGGGYLSFNIDTVSAIGTYSDPSIGGITANVTQGHAPLTVAFSSAVTEGFPTPTYYTWDWDDGTTAGTTQDATHTFTAPGTYYVTLEVWNSKTSQPYPSDGITITVLEPPDSSATFDRTRYLSTETATVSTHIKDYTPASKTYSLRLYKFEGGVLGDLADTWPIASADTTINIDVSDYEPGNYIVYLYETYAGIGTVLAYDTSEFSYTVGYYGKTYNAESGAALSSVSVSLVQGALSDTDTSDASGNYDVSGFITGTPITVSASKAGYTHESITLTPLNTLNYNTNLYLLPTSPSHTGTAIAGIVTDAGTGMAVSGATVSLAGATTRTTTTSATGYYRFDSVTAGTHYVKAQKGDVVSSNETVDVSVGAIEIQNLQLQQGYTVTVTVRDTVGANVEGATVSLIQGGTTEYTGTSDADGKVAFTGVTSGTYTLYSAKDGTSASQTLIVDGDETVTITILSSGSVGGVGQQYPPHNVQFSVKNFWLYPVEGVTVTVAPIETTGEVSWLEDWLGLGEAVDVLGTTMTGTTGSDGSITFMMIQNVKYRMTFYKEGIIDTSYDLTPQDSYYDVLTWNIGVDLNPWLPGGSNQYEIVRVNITTQEIDSDTARIYVEYNDAALSTSTLSITVENSTGTTLDTYTASPKNYVNRTFSVEDYSGETYTVRINATHGDFGEIKRTYNVAFGGRFVEIPGFPDWAYLYLAMGILILIGMIFGASSAEEGGLVICLFGWILLGIGWLQEIQIMGAVGLIFATVAAVVWNMMKWRRKQL